MKLAVVTPTGAGLWSGSITFGLAVTDKVPYICHYCSNSTRQVTSQVGVASDACPHCWRALMASLYPQWGDDA